MARAAAQQHAIMRAMKAVSTVASELAVLWACIEGMVQSNNEACYRVFSWIRQDQHLWNFDSILAE